jgi:nitrile hydratase accessory protein
LSAPDTAASKRPEQPFSAPWEAQVFAMTVKLNEAGVFSWSDWTKALGAELHGIPERPYYESWLAALEKLLEVRSLMSGAERLARIDAWDRAAKATPHGQPIELQNAHKPIL